MPCVLSLLTGWLVWSRHSPEKSNSLFARVSRKGLRNLLILSLQGTGSRVIALPTHDQSPQVKRRCHLKNLSAFCLISWRTAAGERPSLSRHADGQVNGCHGLRWNAECQIAFARVGRQGFGSRSNTECVAHAAVFVGCDDTWNISFQCLLVIFESFARRCLQGREQRLQKLLNARWLQVVATAVIFKMEDNDLSDIHGHEEMPKFGLFLCCFVCVNSLMLKTESASINPGTWRTWGPGCCCPTYESGHRRFPQGCGHKDSHTWLHCCRSEFTHWKKVPVQSHNSLLDQSLEYPLCDSPEPFSQRVWTLTHITHEVIEFEKKFWTSVSSFAQMSWHCTQHIHWYPLTIGL